MGWFAVWLMWLWPLGPESGNDTARTVRDTMTKDEILVAAKDFMRGLGVADAALAKVGYGPPPLFDGNRTKPFHFIATKPEAGPPGRVDRVVCVAVDERDGRVFHKDEAAIRVFAQALGLPANAATVDGNRIFTAILALRDGEPPNVAKGPTAVGDPAIGALVKPPSFELAGEHAVLTGWTSNRTGHALVRHRIVFKKDGTVELQSANGSDLLK
jgi:hypothetical protein